MSAPRVPKRLQAIVKVAEAAGWRYDVTRKGHPRLTPPGGSGAPVTFALTPSDKRGDKNSIAALRRAGLRI